MIYYFFEDFYYVMMIFFFFIELLKKCEKILGNLWCYVIFLKFVMVSGFVVFVIGIIGVVKFVGDGVSNVR